MMYLPTYHPTTWQYSFNRQLRSLLLGLLLSCSMALAYAQSPGRPLYLKGNEAKKSGKCTDAIGLYAQAIQLEKLNYRYYVAKGDCEVQLKNYNDALQSYKSAVQAKKDFSVGYMRIASVYIKQKNLPQAVQALNQAYDIEQDASKKITYKVATIKLLLQQNKPQEALLELNKAKALAPDDVRVIGAEGDIYLAMNNYPQSITSYQKAVAKVQGQPPAQAAKYYFGLGKAYYKSGDTKKADETWKNLAGTRYERLAKAFTLQSGARYYAAVASGYLRANVLDEAQDWAQKAVTAEPTSPLGYRVLATVQVKKGQIQQAIPNFNKAADNEKDEVKRTKIYSSMIKVQFSNGDYNGALATANKILTKFPTNATILGLKAQAEYQLGQYANSIASTDKAITAANTKDATKTAPYYFTQGLAAKKNNDFDKARTAFKQAGAAPVFRLAAKVETDKLASK